MAGCHDPASVNPPDNTLPTDCDEPKSTQNYTWRIDTVGNFGSSIGGVYAFSDSDAYVMGFLMKNDRNAVIGLHWNGNVWSENIYATPLEIGHVSLASTGDKNIMVSVGMDGFGNPNHALAEFDNRTKKWKKKVYSEPGQFYSVWTDKKGFYAAGGSNGFLVYKNGEGSDWVKQDVPPEASGNIRYIEGLNLNDLFLSVEKYENLDFRYQFWRVQNNGWKKIYDSFQPDSNRYLKVKHRTDFFGFDINYCGITNRLMLFAYAFGNLEILEYSHEKDWFFEADVPYRNGIGGSAHIADAFATNDIWFTGILWHHWDGKTVNYIEFSGYQEFTSSWNATRSPSGKVFLPLGRSEGSFSYTWVIAQGTPNY